MKLAVQAGRMAYLSGRMNKNKFAIASSPKKDFLIFMKGYKK